MYKIEKNVAIPAMKGGTAKYPWKQMEVGDCFFVPGKTQRSFGAQASISGKRFGMKFVTRKEGDGVRVWRIE